MAGEVEFTVHGPSMDAWGDHLGNYIEFSGPMIRRVLDRLGQGLVPYIAQETPRDTGTLGRSTKYVIHEYEGRATDQEIATGWEIGAKVRVFELDVLQPARNDFDGMPYQDFVVVGRGPGKPPPALALQGWVSRHWGFDNLEDKVRNLQRHIAAHGTEGHEEYLLNAVFNAKPLIDEAAYTLGSNLTIKIHDVTFVGNIS